MKGFLILGHIVLRGMLAKRVSVDHVGFGMVLGEDGKHIRTRASGEVSFDLIFAGGAWAHPCWSGLERK